MYQNVKKCTRKNNAIDVRSAAVYTALPPPPLHECSCIHAPPLPSHFVSFILINWSSVDKSHVRKNCKYLIFLSEQILINHFLFIQTIPAHETPESVREIVRENVREIVREIVREMFVRLSVRCP